MTSEPRETRLKRLAMRSMRRGTKEMDILMMRFAEARLATLSDAELDAYDALLSENDQDLYTWVSGQVAPPDVHKPMIRMIKTVSAASA